jgi:hypothetical protein
MHTHKVNTNICKCKHTHAHTHAHTYTRTHAHTLQFWQEWVRGSSNKNGAAGMVYVRPIAGPGECPLRPTEPRQQQSNSSSTPVPQLSSRSSVYEQQEVPELEGHINVDNCCSRSQAAKASAPASQRQQQQHVPMPLPVPVPVPDSTPTSSVTPSSPSGLNIPGEACATRCVRVGVGVGEGVPAGSNILLIQGP